MLECPNCDSKLTREQTPCGIVFACPTCFGRMAGMAFLRNNLFSHRHLNQIWQEARNSPVAGVRQCPHCGQKMKQALLPRKNTSLELDVCIPCQQIWFDPGEDTQLPREHRVTLSPPARPIFPEAVQERISRGDCNTNDLNLLDYRTEASPEQGESPGSTLKTIWGYLGLPVEVDAPRVTVIPWLTWSVIIAIVAVAAAALKYGTHTEIIQNWGFIPALWGRHYGLTTLTGFFIHGGIIHLLGNIYFLYITGDNAEQELGTWRFLLLLLSSALSATLLHGIFNYRSTIPCIGASGGICGVMAFYAITFPQARIGFCLRFRYSFAAHWMYVPAPVAMLIFILLQIAMISGGKDSGIAVWAHLGGIIPGVIWALWRRLAPCSKDLKEDIFDARSSQGAKDYYKF